MLRAWGLRDTVRRLAEASGTSCNLGPWADSGQLQACIAGRLLYSMHLNSKDTVTGIGLITRLLPLHLQYPRRPTRRARSLMACCWRKLALRSQ